MSYLKIRFGNLKNTYRIRFLWDFTDEEKKPVVKENIERKRQGINEIYEFNYVHPDDQDCVIKGAQQVLERKLSGVDYRIISVDGEERKK